MSATESVEVKASTLEARDVLSLLPDGWSVRRRDYMVVGEWRGYVFVAFDEGGVPRISANVLVDWTDRRAMNGSWSSHRVHPAPMVRAQAVVLLLAAIEAERWPASADS